MAGRDFRREALGLLQLGCLCDGHGTLVFRRLVEAAPESAGGGFFSILIEPLGLSGWVQLSEGKFLAGREP